VVLIVEQRLIECLEIVDLVYAMQTGRVLMSGTAAQIRDNVDLRRVYFGL
jgi:branched-chain amino acid transport system ATP-binding protein